MLPAVAQAWYKGSLGSIDELAEFSFDPPDDEEDENFPTTDTPVGYSGESESFTRLRSSDDSKCSSGNNGSHQAQSLSHSSTVNRSTNRSVFDPTASPSYQEWNQRSFSHLHSLDQCGRPICDKGSHSIKKHRVTRTQFHYATRRDLLKRLEQGSSEAGLADELRVMISMMERMNILLRGLDGTAIVGAPKINLNAHTMYQATALATQMMHYFNELGKNYEHQIDNIAKIKSYLPDLGPHMKSILVRTALKMWNERIITSRNLAAAKPHEQDTFTSLATFYATQVYTIFIMRPQYPPKHPLHTLATILLEHIPSSMAHVCATHAAFIGEIENLATAMSESRARLLSALGPAGCIQEYRQERESQCTMSPVEREARIAGIALNASASESLERHPRRARGTPGRYPMFSLQEFMATATARREEAAKAKGKILTKGEEVATAQSKGKQRLPEGRGREEKGIKHAQTRYRAHT